MGDDQGVYLMRISLPDRPGSLGAVATALGAVGVNIHAVEVVERGGGFTIDDFMVEPAPERLVDSIVTACNKIPGVSVVWISRYPSGGNLQSDLETLDSMENDPEHAAETLVSASPVVFRAHWGLLLATSPQPVAELSTSMAPDLETSALAHFGPFDAVHRVDLDDEWLPGWGSATAAVAPLSRDRAIVVGRQGGPPFLASELARLGHLATLA